MTYAEILDFIKRNNESGNNGVYWKFQKLISHREVKDSSVDGMGSKYNLLIKWGNRERTAEPLAKVLEDVPYEVALYVMQNNLFDKPGWKRCKRFARMQNIFTARFNIKFLKRQVTKAKTEAFWRAPK